MNKEKQTQQVEDELFKLMMFGLEYYRNIIKTTGDFTETDFTEILSRLGIEACDLGRRDAYDRIVGYAFNELDSIPDPSKV